MALGMNFINMVGFYKVCGSLEADTAEPLVLKHQEYMLSCCSAGRQQQDWPLGDAVGEPASPLS